MCVIFSFFILHFVYVSYTEIKNSNGDTTSVSDAKKKTSVVQNESRVEPTILRFASSLPRIFRDCARICYRVRSWATRCVCVLACLLLVHMPPMDPMPSWVVTDSPASTAASPVMCTLRFFFDLLDPLLDELDDLDADPPPPNPRRFNSSRSFFATRYFFCSAAASS